MSPLSPDTAPAPAAPATAARRRPPLRWPRQWHGTLAVVVLLPFLILAVTGVLFAHGNALGLRQIQVPVAWLPGYGADDQPALRSAVPDGKAWWLLTPQGVVRLENGRAQTVAALRQAEVRSLQATPQGLIAIGARGLWQERRGDWRLILRGPVLQAGGDGKVLTALLRGRGLVASHDGGQSWQPLAPALAPALAGLAPVGPREARISLAQLVHDLHTGRALLTEKWDWLWQDVLGLVLCFLAGSGVYLWWRRPRGSRGRARA